MPDRRPRARRGAAVAGQQHDVESRAHAARPPPSPPLGAAGRRRRARRRPDAVAASTTRRAAVGGQPSAAPRRTLRRAPTPRPARAVPTTDHRAARPRPPRRNCSGARSRRTRRRRAARRRRSRAASGCSEPGSTAAARRKSPSSVTSAAGSTTDDHRSPLGQRAGLVEDHDRDVGRPLQRVAALDQDAQLGAAAGGHHDRGRHGEPHRARAGDDEHRDAGGEGPARRRRRRRTATRPRTSASASAITTGTNTALMRSARCWIGARVACASRMSRTICASTLEAPPSVVARHEHAGPVDGAADDRVAGALRDRQRLAGQHRLVDRRAALDDDAVDRQSLARADHTRSPVATGPTATSCSHAIADDAGRRRLQGRERRSAAEVRRLARASSARRSGSAR